MKAFIIACSLLFILSSCRQSNAPSPMKFVAYGNNPILSAGDSVAWDALGVHTPEIVFHNNIFYLFYTGSRVPGSKAIGLATSNDGFHFTKFTDNPVLAPDNKGFDAYSTGPPRIVKVDTGWLMYYNAMEVAGFNPGPYIGMARANDLTGPWVKNNKPVMISGKKGEWDAGFVIPSSIVVMEDGSLMMHYVGANEYYALQDFCIGMATSRDGIIWKKYDDPATMEHPFAGSDPVFNKGKESEWDGMIVWIADIIILPDGFGMYYTGMNETHDEYIYSIGYATSEDGIHWERYAGNPIFTPEDDPYTKSLPDIGCIENPAILILDSICFMYYDYGSVEVKISVAVAR